MRNFIFITGGIRSGKSLYAQKLAEKLGNKVIFIATCVPKDEEMKSRVVIHKKNRPSHWKTIEEEKNIVSVLCKINPEVVVIDCLTLFISNLLFLKKTFEEIKKEVEKIIITISKSQYTTIIVSNEVGYGIIPNNKLSRKFCDILGISNQIIANNAKEVYFIVAGQSLKIK